jgi:hypothetical protein
MVGTRRGSRRTWARPWLRCEELVRVVNAGRLVDTPPDHSFQHHTHPSTTLIPSPHTFQHHTHSSTTTARCTGTEHSQQRQLIRDLGPELRHDGQEVLQRIGSDALVVILEQGERAG